MKLSAGILLISFALIADAPGLLSENREGQVDRDPAPMQLAWVDRTGEVQGTVGPAMSSILDPAISPDETEIAVRGRENRGDTDSMWILEGTAKRRVTDNTGFERHMAWSPDGTRLAYSLQNEGGVSNLYIRAADGSGSDEPLVVSEGAHKWYPSWTPDGATLVYHLTDPEADVRDLWSVNVADGKTEVLVESPALEALAQISPDGRFVAYQSDEGGEMNIWVTTFPRSDQKWQVSKGGGTWAKWSEDELFFWQGNTLMAVTVGDGDTFSPGTPQKLFTGEQVGMGADNMMTSYNPEYDVTLDGTRFIVSQRVSQ